MNFWFEDPGYIIEHQNLFAKNPTIAVPYLIGISIALIVGSVGNIMIVGAIYVSKVT